MIDGKARGSRRSYNNPAYNNPAYNNPAYNNPAHNNPPTTTRPQNHSTNTLNDAGLHDRTCLLRPPPPSHLPTRLWSMG